MFTYHYYAVYRHRHLPGAESHLDGIARLPGRIETMDDYQKFKARLAEQFFDAGITNEAEGLTVCSLTLLSEPSATTEAEAPHE